MSLYVLSQKKSFTETVEEEEMASLVLQDEKTAVCVCVLDIVSLSCHAESVHIC